MTKFVKALANGEILSHHSYRLMHRRYTPNFVDNYGYGYGVFVDTSQGVDFYFHTGDQPHARTIVLYVPSKDMGVAIMCNNADFTFSRKIKLAQDLLKTIGGPF